MAGAESNNTTNLTGLERQQAERVQALRHLEARACLSKREG